MEKTLKALNELERAGVISKYAIGGAIAVLFYAEPVLTYDMDVFCFLPERKGSLVTLSPIYSYLKDKGYREDKEHIMIEGLPVQFIPAYNDLVVEALAKARSTKFKGTKTRVVRLEHLAAILLQTDRPKDRARLPQLLEHGDLDRQAFAKIIKRHHLGAKWKKIKRENRANT
jgi:hypothetical protein